MTKITANNNGPLVIEGDMQLCDAAGQTFGLAGRTRISLCRCGASAKKPFCDGAHKSAGFASQVTAVELPPPVAKPA